MLEVISYKILEDKKFDQFVLSEAPERAIQFGEGNFLRAFVDYFVDIMNESQDFDCKVLVVQPIEKGQADVINRQQGLYQVYLKGIDKGELKNERRLISCLSRAISPYEDFKAFLDSAKNMKLRFIFTNTTEAGIVYDEECEFDDSPPLSFPGKLTRFLYERYSVSAEAEGFIILSCELIDDNGSLLKEYVLRHAEKWNLGEGFKSWIEDSNYFCNTLVDRIVTGYPGNSGQELNQQNGFTDALMTVAEPFGLWVIEGPKSLEEELPFAKAGLPVIFTDNLKPFKTRKVRILNGIHTIMVPVGLLYGKELVRHCMEEKALLNFIEETIFKEIIPTLSLPEEELNFFARAVVERLKNPYVDHRLLDISLNSISKWNTRVLPSLKKYLEKFGVLPENIVFSFAALLLLYCNSVLTSEIRINDGEEVLECFRNHCGKNNKRELINELIGSNKYFDEDLTNIDGFVDRLIYWMEEIERKGVKGIVDELFDNQ